MMQVCDALLARTCMAVFAALMLLLAPSLARAADDPTPDEAFVIALQKALRDNDKGWFAAHIHYPAKYFGRRRVIIRSRAAVLKNFKTLLGGEKLRANVLDQDPQKLFRNYQGIMIGQGSHNIWIDNFGKDDVVRYEIVTINDSER